MSCNCDNSMDKNLEFGMEIGLGLGMFLTDKPDINL